MPTTFSHVISLGSDCDVALQLERHEWLTTPSPFDWLITPWPALLAIFADCGARLSTTFEDSPGDLRAVCKPYGVVYYHEFELRDDVACIEPERAAYCRQKLLYKMSRLDEACRGKAPVLFIRCGNQTDAPQDRAADFRPMDGRDLDGFAGLLSTLYPDLLFSLIYVERQGEDAPLGAPPADPRISVVGMPPSTSRGPGDPCWASNHHWHALLKQIPVCLKADRRMFAEQRF